MLLLQRCRDDTEALIAIERFDDISFERGGTPLELIQTKHHLSRAGDLTDTSPDLWKTLRAWSAAVKSGTISPPSAIFTIVTTAKAADGSAASLLKDGADRDVRLAQSLLLSASARMAGATTKAARDAFTLLGPKEQQAMLECVHVVDRAPTIVDVGEAIHETLRFAAPLNRAAVFQEYVEGWWFGQVIDRLSGRTGGPISAHDLDRAIDDIRDSFRADSLPINFQNVYPPEGAVEKDRRFLEQLKLIRISGKLSNWATVDFYRAYSQRSKWLKDNLVAMTQLDEYDACLIEEWERERDRLEAEVRSSESDEGLVLRGGKLYDHLQRTCRPIRPSCVEAYVGRGSYHMLADSTNVGWHPNFRALLAAGDTDLGGNT
jgi:hypothetical protein